MERLSTWIGVMSVLLLSCAPASGQERAPESRVIDVIDYEIKVEIQPDRSFLEGEAKVDMRNIDGNTALFVSAWRGNLTMVELLLDQKTGWID